MNDVYQNGKNQNYEKTYPGCLGRMVNLFEVNLGVTANKLLTDKPHRDGSPLSRSRSDVSRMSPSHDQIVEKVIVADFRNTSPNKKSNGTPMKMLIAQELSKETVSKRSPPNLVAKLMGLDTLPPQQSDSATVKIHCRGHPRSHSDIPLGYWEQQNEFFNYVEPNEYKGIHEIWHQSQKSPHKGRYDEAANNKKMAFVRQKFDEAKRLSMDVKLRQSKQFHDALEVLNSNKDLFIKCLQEPNSIFSEHLYNLHSLPPPSETKRITVLKPSKMADGNTHGKQLKNNASPHSACKNYENAPQLTRIVVLNTSPGKPHDIETKRITVLKPSKIADGYKHGKQLKNNALSPSACMNYEIAPQPTRIVVLKPSPGIPHDITTMDSPQSESPRILHGEDFLGDVEDYYDDDDQESREVAKAITQQMCEKLGRDRRDETLISSVFSNGYAGDESSFNKSEIDYDAGNLTDSEAVSPVSRQSWDYVNRIGSPNSCSSFSRASYSPESSVCREAKKRLSERWAMMASNGSYQEQRHVRRSSSTLGEMLALSEAKKAGEESISSEKLKDLNSVLVNEQKTEEILDNSLRNLMRSKSVPVSCIEFGSKLNLDVSASDNEKQEAAKEETKAKNAKLSFKGKVSSLFFSRNKKPTKDKSIASETKHQVDSYSGEFGSGKPESVSGKGSNHLPLGVMEPSSKASFWNLIDKHNMSSHETGASGKPGENQDQPSPISVLDPPFEDDIHAAKLLPHVKPEQQGIELPLNSFRSNLIDKSPPIGSIARTLSWDESCVDTASSYPVKESLTIQRTNEEEQELFSFVKTLLSVSGVEGDKQSTSYFARWHSPDSPLDPSLRENYTDIKDKETLHEAKRRRNRSIRKLVFDCVNIALIEISGYRPGSGKMPIISVLENATSTLLDEVWTRVTLWLSGAGCVSNYDNGDDSNLIVEKVVINEVGGNGWINELIIQVDNLGREIEGELLEELVQETVAELTGRT